MKHTDVVAVVHNRITRLLDPYPQELLEAEYRFHPPSYQFMPAYRMGRWDGYIRMLKRGSLPTGLFFATRRQVEQDYGFRFSIVDQRKRVECRDKGPRSDRPYQNDCVEEMVWRARRGAGGLVLAATGTGKTRLVGMFLSRVRGECCFVVDRKSLLYQAQKEIAQVTKERVGVIGDSEFKPGRITCATSQTLDRHRETKKLHAWMARQQVAVIDELHTMMGRRTFQTVKEMQPHACFGLTATLELQKKAIRTGAYALTGPVIFEFPVAEAVEGGYLTKGAVVQVELDTRTESKDYAEVIVDNPVRNSVVEELVREGYRRNRYCLVLVSRIHHLALLSKQFRDIPHRAVSGIVAVEDRLAAQGKFEKGTVRLILASEVFSKGVDIKRVDMIVDAAALKSKNTALQKFGRGVRLCPEKTGLLYFDIADFTDEPESRFERAATSRRMAFKKAKIPFAKIAWESAVEALDTAENLLQPGDVQKQQKFEFTKKSA